MVQSAVHHPMNHPMNHPVEMIENHGFDHGSARRFRIVSSDPGPIRGLFRPDHPAVRPAFFFVVH